MFNRNKCLHHSFAYLSVMSSPSMLLGFFTITDLQGDVREKIAMEGSVLAKEDSSDSVKFAMEFIENCQQILTGVIKLKSIFTGVQRPSPTPISQSRPCLYE